MFCGVVRDLSRRVGSIHGNKNDELLYIVRDDDTLAVVEELLVIRSRSISTVVGGGVSGISDLKKKKEKLINQNYVIFNIQFPWMFELVPTPSQVPASIRLFTVASMSSSPPTQYGFNKRFVLDLFWESSSTI